MKDDIAKMLRNKITEKAKIPVRAKSAIADPDEAGTNYDKIATILNNPIINTAAICEIVLGDKEATNRSLFRKKLNREPNENGSTYTFDEEELIKITNALMSFSTQIRRTIGKQGKG